MKEIVTLAGKKYEVEDGIYNPIEKKSPFEKRGGTYVAVQMNDGTLILTANEKTHHVDYRKLNRYGRMRILYLERDEEKSQDLNWMLMQGELMDHLLAIQKQVERFKDIEIPRMMEAQGVTEKLKEEDPIEWAQRLSNIQSSIEEIIQREIITQK